MIDDRFDLRVEEFRAALHEPLTIARGTSAFAHTAIVRLRWNDHVGLGEAAPIERYGESLRTVMDYYAGHSLPAGDAYALDALLEGIPRAARCGIDIALHDIIGKDLDRPLWRLLGLDPAKAATTAFTLGIQDIDATVDAVRRHRDAPILKIKLGLGDEIETVAAIRAAYTGIIRLDANEGWTPEQTVVLLREMERFDIEFCEQPIPAGSPAALRWIRERTAIPIVVDEDAVIADDLPALAGCVDGINIKLAKCGGIRAALEMIHVARVLRLKIMIGCMVESSILATAAAQLTPLVDWADIDGPLLITGEPFSGVQYVDNRLVLPDAPGIGCSETGAAAS